MHGLDWYVSRLIFILCNDKYINNSIVYTVFKIMFCKANIQFALQDQKKLYCSNCLSNFKLREKIMEFTYCLGEIYVNNANQKS